MEALGFNRVTHMRSTVYAVVQYLSVHHTPVLCQEKERADQLASN